VTVPDDRRAVGRLGLRQMRLGLERTIAHLRASLEVEGR
jgi:hypothetical protein